MPRLVSILLRAAQTCPDSIATRYAGREQTWLALADRVAKLACALRELGLMEGDRVALAARNGDRFLEAVFAITWAGGVLQPINLRLAQLEIVEQVHDAGTTLLVADAEGLAAMGDLASALKILFLDDAGCPHGALPHGSAVQSRPAALSERAGDELAVLAYTGGTTGWAKGVMLSHRNVLASAVIGQFINQACSTDVLLHATPMFHVAGLLMLLRTSLGGACHCFLPRFDAGAWLAEASRYGVTCAGLAPVMLDSVLQHPDFATTALPALRRIVYGAAPMPEAILRKAIMKLPQVGFVQGYGLTESTSGCVFLMPQSHVTEGPHATRLRSAGQAVPGIELTILASDGRPAPQGDVGEVCFRGDVVMLGYWNRPDETKAALKDGWLHTGDVGYLDRGGFLFLVDRLKDMIVSGGENVYSAEVEAALQTHVAVEECAVFGIPDERWGERVHAVVRLRPGADVDGEALHAHCGARLARYKCPRSFEVTAKALPRSAVGKVLKAALRAPHWEGQMRNIH